MKRFFEPTRRCLCTVATCLLTWAGCTSRSAPPDPIGARPAPAAAFPAGTPGATPPHPTFSAPPPAWPTDTVLVAGEPLSVGTRVVLFDEMGGYNAYRGPSYFNQRRDETRPASGSGAGPASPPDRAALNQLIDRVVLHYDVAGLSSRCFRILQHERGLSCHFLLDVDGTIYQTLDLRERAWHAGTSNSRSVGIEIANVGAYPKGSHEPLSRWYRPQPGGGTRLILPPDSGVRHPERARQPARPSPVTGPVHGRQLVQYDLTDAQYVALTRLLAALCRAFPRMTPDAPRIGGDPAAAVLPGLMTAGDRVGFGGIVGHHHLTRDKVDPGPAFDWPRVLRGVRAELGEPRIAPHREP